MNHLRKTTLATLICCSLAASAAEKFKTEKGPLVITPINHATLVIEWGGKTIYVDPVGQLAWYKAFPKPDVVLLTHIHGDHFKAKILNAVAGPKTQLIAPPALASAMEANLKKQTIALANGKATDKVGFKVEECGWFYEWDIECPEEMNKIYTWQN